MAAGDVVLRNPDVARLNAAIVSLFQQRPQSVAAKTLYTKWGRFITGPYYAASPDTMLAPVYSAFANTYAVVARINDIDPKDVDPRLIALVTGDANATIESVGRALDETLAATERVATKATTAVAKPAMLVGAGLLLVALARGNIRLGARRR